MDLGCFAWGFIVKFLTVENVVTVLEFMQMSEKYLFSYFFYILKIMTKPNNLFQMTTNLRL